MKANINLSETYNNSWLREPMPYDMPGAQTYRPEIANTPTNPGGSDFRF